MDGLVRFCWTSRAAAYWGCIDVGGIDTVVAVLEPLISFVKITLAVFPAVAIRDAPTL
jgi:hypothetical protein